jgi:hypothetical protein
MQFRHMLFLIPLPMISLYELPANAGGYTIWQTIERYHLF